MKFKSTKNITIFSVLVSLIVCISLNSQITCAVKDMYIPINVTGFNKNVVINSLEEYQQVNAVDVEDNVEHDSRYVFYSSSYRDMSNHESAEIINERIANGEGVFPSGKVITTSTGKNFKIQPSGDKNTIQISANNTAEALTPVDGVIYSKIAFLIMGGNGEPEILATVKYTDGTESDPLSVIAYDWYMGLEDKKVYGNIGRVNIADNAIPYQGYVEFADWLGKKCGLYEYVISGLDINKKIDSIKFNYHSGNGIANIFAVSGLINNSIEIPTALPATNVTDNSFTANWTQTDDAVKYCLDVATDADFLNMVIDNQIITDNYCDLKNLESNTKYYYRVYSITESDRSDCSNIMSVSTSTKKDTMEIIQNPEDSNLNGNSEIQNPEDSNLNGNTEVQNPETGDNKTIYNKLFVILIISTMLVIAINDRKYRIKT